MRILQPFYNTSLACPQKTRYNANRILHAQGELMKKIAFFDIDGTLTSEIDGSIPVSAIEAIRAARANGNLMFINTGRCFQNVEERFRSRFEWGVPIDIHAPDYETRMAILKNKVEMNGYKNISDNILEYIANNVTYNVRELEGALNKISVYAELGNVTITEDLAKNILKDMISKETNVTITPDLIINTVSEHLNISVDDIKSSKRSQDVANARQISMYLCRKFTTKGLKSIGDVFGGKDHSTVLSNINKVDKRIESDPEYAETIDVIIKKLSPHS